MKYLILVLVLVFQCLTHANADASLGQHLDAKYNCAWGDQNKGGTFTVFMDSGAIRAKVLLEKHYVSGDFVKSETGWFDGPISQTAGIYILGQFGNSLLLVNGVLEQATKR